ncbi:dihydrofolate reductase [Rhodoplanes sp. TEM]|uniref:Dihydrofolate reductase n=1 Tax=Rhodoplanes tepidamans TaxID=200616 RepID=A0ABT5J7E8_RHOTP|nr:MULTISPECIES: dihydrofolate reductase [Rhodoplanes]MDC7785581.1 dihydrofolate reductase [Rhodoplanes tepidamans]MDC7985220.1 dihydrofolate reductase [Rhodoplanes sp. TEM]MDQ0353249.1 dihydrofolate reductase [Rhodoplanes tepidamans]
MTARPTDRAAAGPELVLVAAVAANGVIGRAGGLPWRLKSDMRHFRTLTLGHPVVMGRRTFESIGKPLPGRTTIVATRDRSFAAPGVVAAASLEAALAVARADALRRGAGAVMLAGGGELYRAAMPLADRLEITRVDVSPAGDAEFPEIDPGVWREVARTPGTPGPEDEAPFTFCTYSRLAAAEGGA